MLTTGCFILLYC